MVANIFKKNKNQGQLVKSNQPPILDINLEWPEPWWFLKDEHDLILGLQKELLLEVGPKHPLWELKPMVLARSETNDDIIVHLNDGRFASVHLVWHGCIDQKQELYPSSQIFSGIEELQEFINSESENYS